MLDLKGMECCHFAYIYLLPPSCAKHRFYYYSRLLMNSIDPMPVLYYLYYVVYYVVGRVYLLVP